MTVLPQVRRQLHQAASQRARRRRVAARWSLVRIAPVRPSHVLVALGTIVPMAIAGVALALLAGHRPAAHRATVAVAGGGAAPGTQKLYGKRRGGVLAVYSSDAFEHLDPGQTYDYPNDYAVDSATQRPLFSYLPNSTSVSPDLAVDVPSIANGGITDGGKTVTVRIRAGIYFSPPVDREVTSADVAYAIERAANPNVAGPYFSTYFGAGTIAPLVGAQSPSYTGGPIPGIQTPDKFTIVFHTIKPSGSFLVRALSLPISAPVPQSFAGPLDQHSPTTYGSKYLVATGPYMVKSDSSGMIAGIGYKPQPPTVGAIGHLELVRNPNWNARTDYRPAYLDRIEISFGGDPSGVGKRVLKSSAAVQLGAPEPSIVKLASDSYQSQVTFTPGAGDQYVALNNSAGVFRDQNLRKAVWAALDREALVALRGGPQLAQPMTHFIYPGIDGFTQAGSYAGPQVDYNTDVNGNMAVATKYMKRAGYPSGRYTGNATLQVVGANAGGQPAITSAVNNVLLRLGFHTHVTLVNPSVMYTKYCMVPRQEVDVCATVGWVGDFADPMTVLYKAFYGPAISASQNTNFGQVNDPEVNAAMMRAALVVDQHARALAWANVDRMLVEKAVAVPETFDSQANVEGTGVDGVDQMWNAGAWDLDFTSLP